MTKLLVLCGGRSSEHEISLISAKGILDALDRTVFTPIVVGISKKGVWHLEDEKNFYTGEFRADQIKLNEAGTPVTLAPYLTPAGRGQLMAAGKSIEFDAVFPILHGPFGEDGTMQGLWDVVGIPYVGSTCGSSWIAMDKELAKTLCLQNNIPVSDFVVLRSIDEAKKKRAEVEKLGKTVFVKPARAGSSVGVSKVVDMAGYDKAVELAFAHDKKVLVEQGIDGREIECGVLGLCRKAKASVPGEIVVAPKIGWYSYEAKYLLKDGAETLTPAPLDAKTQAEVQRVALATFDLFECDGLARVDMFLERNTGKIYLNEANTIPGFTPISMYPKMWEATGVSYRELIAKLVGLAFERLGKPLPTK